MQINQRRVLLGRRILSAAWLMLWNSIIRTTSALCPSACSGHGTCSTTNICICDPGFTDIDCSYRECPKGTPWVAPATADDVARSTMVECSNMGKCEPFRGVCDCEIGYEGPACERKTCPRACNGHGSCMSMKEASAEVNDYNLFHSYSYTNVWDATKLYGCVCDRGYVGADCSIISCPSGDDPLTTGQIDEVQILSCLCDGCSGSFMLSFRDEFTTAISPSDSVAQLQTALEALRTIRDVTLAIYDGTTVCDADGVSIKVTFTHNPGDLPLLRIDSSLTGGTSNLAMQGSGSSGLYGVTGASADGTKENLECSGRGRCNYATGTCSCQTGFASSDGAGGSGNIGDCGHQSAASITECPIFETKVCAENGMCSGASEYKCLCIKDFEGHDCSKRKCPTGRAWFKEATAADTGHIEMVECSNMGICNRNNGLCECFAGFEGAACQRMNCPGDISCSGHGKCLTMYELAQKAEVNGVSTPYTYGSYPNNVATWDAHMIRGCFCDKILSDRGEVLQYSGHDCSRVPCPTGDDPWTTGQNDEVQTVSCTATGGTFKLTFRGHTTTSIAYDATALTLKTALEALQTIDTVTVSFQSSATQACSNGGTNITFTTNSGDLPSLIIDASALTHGTAVSTNVDEFIKGSKESSKCSNRGICDYQLGACICAKDFASSDGIGDVGIKDDCGYRDIHMTHGSL